MSKKVLYLTVFLILLGVIILISNPFYWAMASSAAEQPKLSNKEDNLFRKWKDSCSCNIERFFDYEDGEKAFFNYSLSFESTNRGVLESKESYKIARIVLDSILEQKKQYLREIHIYKVFNREEIDYETKAFYFRYSMHKDSLISVAENDTISVSEIPFKEIEVWGQSDSSYPSFLPDYRITYFARSTPIIGGMGWDVGKTYMVGGNKGEGYDAIHGGSQQEFKNQEVLEAHPKAKPMHCYKNGQKI